MMTVNEALEIYKDYFENSCRVDIEYMVPGLWDGIEDGVQLKGIFTAEQLEAILVLLKHYQENNIAYHKRVF